MTLTIGQKTAISLFISVLLCAGFAVASFAGLFSIFDARFYQPTVINGIKNNLNDISLSLTEFNSLQMQRFTSFTQNESVKKSFTPDQNAEDILKRSELSATLQNETEGLLGIRFVDSGGKRIHYSTFDSDIISKTENSIVFANYNQENEPEYANIYAPNNTAPKLIIDGQKEQFIYAFPFYDSYTAYRGTLFFYISANSLDRFLVRKNIQRVTDSVTLIGNPHNQQDNICGIVFSIPVFFKNRFKTQIETLWHTKYAEQSNIYTERNTSWVLFSKNLAPYGFFAKLYPETMFVFPNTVKTLLLCVFFTTVYLVIFLFFNLKQDKTVIIRNKIRTFQYELLNEYVQKNEQSDWKKIADDIAYHRHDVSNNIKKSLGNMGKKHEKQVDELLEQSWEQILTALGKKEIKTNSANSIGTEEIKKMLEHIISTGGINMNNVTQTVKEEEKIEELEEVDEIDDVEEIEEIAEEEEIKKAAEEEKAEELVEVVDELDELDLLKKSAQKKPQKKGLLFLCNQLKNEQKKVITQKDGVFKVARQVTPAEQSDEKFKELVDSVL